MEEEARVLFDELREIKEILRGIARHLNKVVENQKRSIFLLRAILSETVPPAFMVAFEFSSQPKGELNMPLSLPANTQNEKYYIIGTDANGITGAQLASGQTITVVSADPNTVVVTPDATAAVDNEGVQSVASGTVVPAATPAQLNVAINVTATVLNSDGTTAETAVDTVTVTPAVLGVAVSIGELFEEPISVASAAKKK